MFHFRLHPSQWLFENDGETVFRALELADGRYLISFTSKGISTELFFEGYEVLESMQDGNWIIIDEKGDYLK